MNNSATVRGAEQVFGHHLSAFAEGIESILSDYTESSTLITPDRNYAGLAEIRLFFEQFLQDASIEFWHAFKVLKREVVGEIAYLTWSAPPFVPMATDTLWIPCGAIRDTNLHTSRYIVEEGPWRGICQIPSIGLMIRSRVSEH